MRVWASFYVPNLRHHYLKKFLTISSRENQKYILSFLQKHSIFKYNNIVIPRYFKIML